MATNSTNGTAFNNGQGEANVTSTLQQQNQGLDPGYWHQDLELFFICICSALTIFLIAVRSWLLRRKAKRFRANDYWFMIAGGLTIPYWVCQIGTNRYGSGIHIEDIPASPIWGQAFLAFERGWALYYFIGSMIKVSECMLILDVLPRNYRKTRIGVYVLCFMIMALGTAIALMWFFQCLPVAANFSWYVQATFCLDFGPPRYIWVGFGIAFDMVITVVPIVLLSRMMLKSYERKVLMIMFSANLLGTVFLVTGIYGIWITSNPITYTDYTWTETVYIIFQNLEVLAYTIGASAPVFSRIFMTKSGARSQDSPRRHRWWKISDYRSSKSGSSGAAPADGGQMPLSPVGPPSYHSGRKSSATKPPFYESKERKGSIFTQGSDERKGSLFKPAADGGEPSPTAQPKGWS